MIIVGKCGRKIYQKFILVETSLEENWIPKGLNKRVILVDSSKFLMTTDTGWGSLRLNSQTSYMISPLKNFSKSSRSFHVVQVFGDRLGRRRIMGEEEDKRLSWNYYQGLFFSTDRILTPKVKTMVILVDLSKLICLRT